MKLSYVLLGVLFAPAPKLLARGIGICFSVLLAIFPLALGVLALPLSVVSIQVVTIGLDPLALTFAVALACLGPLRTALG
jgi:hypothetical protein